MKPRLIQGIRNGEPDGAFLFWCPGCECGHAFYTRPCEPGGPVWSFNNDMNSPTFSPSLLNKYPDGRVCHLFLRSGHIQFLGDCFHRLAGQTVDMVPFP